MSSITALRIDPDGQLSYVDLAPDVATEARQVIGSAKVQIAHIGPHIDMWADATETQPFNCPATWLVERLSGQHRRVRGSALFISHDDKGNPVTLDTRARQEIRTTLEAT
jgi:hypothetical protein